MFNIFLLIAFFIPDILLPFERWLYCKIKRKKTNCNNCYFWDCKKFNTCYYNGKTLLDFGRRSIFRFYDCFTKKYVLIFSFVEFIFVLVLVFGGMLWL